MRRSRSSSLNRGCCGEDRRRVRRAVRRSGPPARAEPEDGTGRRAVGVCGGAADPLLPTGVAVIFELILDAIETALTWLIGLFPGADGFSYIGHLETTLANLGALNYFLPIAETFTVVVAVFALFPVFLGVTLALWIAAQLRGSSSIG